MSKGLPGTNTGV